MKNRFLKNVSFVLVANLIATIGSALLSILIPRLVSTTDYGYWQLNNLYGGYIALFHFGWVDGVYIRYAGKDYNNLDKKTHHNQFWMLLFFEFFVSLIGAVLCFYFVQDPNKRFALATVFIASAFSIPMAYILYIFQGCNRIKDYSFATIMNKLLYLALSVFALAIGYRGFKLIIVAGIIATIVSFSFVLFKSRDVVFTKPALLSKADFKETLEDIKCGIKVSLAYLAGAFIIGSIKYFIENQWGINTFGKASLTISLSNLLLVFINAVGLVLLPTIRNVDDNSRKNTYKHLVDVLTIVVIFLFMLYYPLSKVLVLILPKYEESIKMMSLIFPLCLFEGKMGLLNTIYLKALRKENGLLFINLISCLISVGLAFLSVKVFKNFELSVLLILIMLAFRCTISDIYISRVLKLNNWSIISIGLLCSVAFVLCNKCLDGTKLQLIVYLNIFIVICIVSLKRLKPSFGWTIRKVRGR